MAVLWRAIYVTDIIIITGRQTQSLETIGHTRSVSAATDNCKIYLIS